MATIGNYSAALGGALKQTAGGIVKGFGYGLKGAMLSEMPGLVAGYGAFSSLRKDANSMSQAKQAPAQTPTRSQTKPSATGNPFAQMVQQLAQINSNTAMAASVAKASAQAEQYKMMFEEEKAREQAQQNQALIDAIKNSGFGGGGNKSGGSGGGGNGNDKNGIFDFLKNNAKELGGGALAFLLRRQIAGMVSSVMLRALASPLTGAIVGGGIAAASMGATIVTMLRGLMFTALRGLLFTPAGLVAAGIGGLMYYSRKTENKQTKDAVKNNLPVAPMPNKTFEQEAKELREQAKNEKDPLKRTELETKAKAAQNNVAQEKIKNSPLTLENRQKAWKEKYDKSHNATGAPKVVTTGNYLDNLARAESAGDPNAKNPMPGQSASGLFQFTQATWTGTVEKMASKGLIKKEDYADLKYRFDPAKSRKVAEFFTEENRLGLEKALNRPITQTDLYMAHFLGLGGNENGAIRFLKAYAKDPDGLAINYAGADQVAANPSIFYTKDAPPRPRTLKEVYALMSKKIGGGNKPSVGPQTSENDKKPSTGDVPVVGNRSSRKNSKFNVPGYAAQVNKKLTDNAVTKYYKAMSEGKTEAEAKKLALEIASTNTVAKQAVEVASEKFKAEVAGGGGDSENGVNGDGYDFRKLFGSSKFGDNPNAIKLAAGSGFNLGAPLIEMGDGAVAEAAAASPTSNAVVNARNKAIADKFLAERKAEESKKEVVKYLRQTSENTFNTAKEVKSNRITMSKGKFTSPEDILSKANKQFTDSLQKQLTKTISGTLMSALYPGGYKNVSQKTASGQLYRGEQLNKMLGVTPALVKLGTSVFGKQYGPAFGQIFGKAATSYMEVGARSVAQGIFGSMGMNSDQANILGGQILGNLAKGTQQGKLTALEQIIFGVSGGQVALGPETIFAKYGFASPQEGISYMANVLGAAAMGPIDSALGTTPLNMRNMDPRMRQMGAFGGYGGEYGGMPGGMPSIGTQNATLRNDPILQLNKDGMVTITDNMPAQTKTLAEQLNVSKQAEKDAQLMFDVSEKNSQEQHVAMTMLNEAQLQSALLSNQLLASMASRGTGGGGGTSINIGGSKGGGFFSGGGPLAEVGNMALDLGKSVITQKVVQSLGIKNPYMGLLASFAVNKGVSYLGGKALDLFKGTEFGQSVTGAFSNISNSYQMAAPSWAGGYSDAQKAFFNAADAADAAEGAAMAANAGTEVATSTTSFLQGFDFMDALPYAGAIIKLFQGDIKGAALSAAGVFIGNLILPGIGGFIGGFLGGLLGGGGGGGRQPNPTIWRIIRVNGNNNIAAIVDLQAPVDNPPKEFFDLCDALLRVGFNATKAAEGATKKAPPFDFLMTSMNAVDGVYFSMRKGDPASADTYAIHLGKTDKTFNAGKASSEIVKLITTAFKEAYAADATALDNASKLLNKKTYKELSTGLTKELKKGTDKLGTGKLDTTIDRGVFGGTAAEDAIIVAGRTNTPQAAVSGYDNDGYTGNSSPPMVYSMKEGKYIEAPSEMKEVDVVAENDYGMRTTVKVKRKVYDTSVLLFDKEGKPIYDKNNSGGIDLADIVKPTLTTTPATITSGTTAATTTSGATGTTTPVTVVTNADNSQRNNQSINTYYQNTLSKTKNPIRDAMLQTGLAPA